MQIFQLDRRKFITLLVPAAATLPFCARAARVPAGSRGSVQSEGSVSMSHHLDTPLAAQNGQLYIDDLYVFSGEDSTVFIMDVNSNVTKVHVKPGFHHEARYEFKVHFDGAEFETLTYRVSFGEAGPDKRQSMKLYALTGKEAREDAATGNLVLEGRTGEPASAGGTRLWAGRIADSFYIDLSLLAKVNGPVKNGTAVDLSGWQPENAKNSFADTTVESIVLEVPHQHPQLKPGARIGVWCATKLATDAGGWRQINRGGHPMMWPIFWPDDINFTISADTRHPSKDFEEEGEHIAGHIAAMVAASGTSTDPQGYGRTVARALFPDVLPYIVGTPASYGFVTRNGRTLADNAPEVMLSLVAATAVPSGLKPSVTQHLRGEKLPYVVPA
jgi:hypothetical protein